MKKFLFVALTAFAVTASTTNAAFADSNANPYHPDISSSLANHQSWRLGPTLDIGVPSGAAVGLMLHPSADWVRVGASLTYNYLSFGGKASLQLDPMALLPNLPIGLFVDVQEGFAPQANIPGHHDLPQVGYTYTNFYGALRFGKARGFHWNFECGPTYMYATTGNFQSVLNNAGTSGGLKIGNPSAHGWLVPTFVTGFEIPITF